MAKTMEDVQNMFGDVYFRMCEHLDIKEGESIKLLDGLKIHGKYIKISVTIKDIEVPE